MKKYLLLIAMMISPTAKSQTSVYHPFPTGNANWVYQYYDDLHQPTPGFTSYSFNGDTTISSISYKRVFKSFNYSGAIRESNRIIYFVPDTSLNEYLLYDFNLDLGDTLFHPFGGAVCANDTAIVIQIDSILASDGYHRVLWFNSFAYWIEGVGALHYLLNPCNVWCVSGNDFLLCLSTDSSLNYPVGVSSCFVSLTEQAKLENKIVITPNPFHFTSQISVVDEYENAEMKIYNVFGELVKQYTINNLQFTLYREELPNGIYLYQLTNNKGRKESGKFVID